METLNVNPIYLFWSFELPSIFVLSNHLYHHHYHHPAAFEEEKKQRECFFRRRRREAAALFSPPSRRFCPLQRRRVVLGRRITKSAPDASASGVLRRRRRRRRHFRDARGREYPPEKTEEEKTKTMSVERMRTFLASRRRDGERWAACSAPGR